jgi:hypothetical protein
MSRSYDPYAAADNPASDYYEPYTTSTPGPNKRGYTRYDWGGTGSNASAEPPGYLFLEYFFCVKINRTNEKRNN